MIAHDTRSSAASLCQAAAAGIAAVEGTAEPPLLLTTPQLHWMVAQRNQGRPYSEADYYDSILGAFEQLVSTFCSAGSAQVCLLSGVALSDSLLSNFIICCTSTVCNTFQIHGAASRWSRQGFC